VREVLDFANTFGADGSIALSLDTSSGISTLPARPCGGCGRRVDRREARRNRTARVVRRLARADRARLLSGPRAGQRAGVARPRRARRLRPVADPRGARDRPARLAGPGIIRRRPFAPGASQVLAARPYSGGPRSCGGPGLVLPSHTHHDYPAVDIAAARAPHSMPSPTRSCWRASAVPGSRCGIGHDPGLRRPGLDRIATSPTGIRTSSRGRPSRPGRGRTRGSTGHATGPHLHLQHQPATSWPQQKPGSKLRGHRVRSPTRHAYHGRRAHARPVRRPSRRAGALGFVSTSQPVPGVRNGSRNARPGHRDVQPPRRSTLRFGPFCRKRKRCPSGFPPCCRVRLRLVGLGATATLTFAAPQHQPDPPSGHRL
jgi:hypothetical protein